MVSPIPFPLASVGAFFFSDANKGGTLGFYCTYPYAHTSNEADIRLPWALKGIDAIIFTVFQRLGLKVMMHPIQRWTSYRTGEGPSFRAQMESLGTNFEGALFTNALKG